VRRRSSFFAFFALLAVVLVACQPVKDPPPAAPTPPPLPAAPGGVAATPALNAGAGPEQPLGAPDPDVITVDPSWCASIPPTTTTSTTSTTSTTAPTTTTTTAPPSGAPGCYYSYSTPTIMFAPTAVPVFRSTDLRHWFPAGPPDSHGDPSGIAFDGIPGAKGAAFPLWAPSVRQTGPDRFVMWVAEKATSVGQMCLWSATATSPDGPFTYSDGPNCNTGQGGLIDPAIYADGSGNLYLTYKSEGMGAPYVPTRIFVSQLVSTAEKIKGGTEHQLLEVMPAPSFEYPIVEAPTLMRSPGGTLFLFYSAYNWYTAGYKVAVAKCDAPLGPCNRVYSTPVLASRGAMLGPGGQTPFQDSAGTWQLAFHAWAPADVQAAPVDGSKRSLRILPITFPGGNPKIG
jgi:beta-xylosidase